MEIQANIIAWIIRWRQEHTRKLCFSLLHLSAFAVFAAALAAGGLAAAAAGPASCGAPQISSRVNFHGEKIEYDREIAFTVIGKSRERVWGKYETERKVGLTTDFEGECLRRLDVLVDVFPTIHLMRDYHDRQYRCARQSYQGLPRRIGELAREMFSRPSGEGHEAILEELGRELDGGTMITKFLGDLDKNQDAFHAKERLDGSIAFINCRLIKREGKFRSKKRKAKPIVLECRLKKTKRARGAFLAKKSGRKTIALICTRT